MKTNNACTYQVTDNTRTPLFIFPFSLRPIKYSRHLVALVAALCLLAFTPKAQSQTLYQVMPGSLVTVAGTSTLHDWTMQASDFKSEGSFVLTAGQLQDVTGFNFSLPVTNLKSKEEQMDSRAYKALKANEFAHITFKLTGATVVPQQKIIKATGNLTIGGVTKLVALQTTYILNGDESITCKGSAPIKMSDYKIQAPSFMMGSIKTGDAVTVDILLKLKKQNPKALQ